MHCFSDSLQYAQELLARWPKLRIGFTGAITFQDGKAKGKGGKVKRGGMEHCRELVQGLPLDRLLIAPGRMALAFLAEETDGPYMCPEPFRGQTAHPGHVHRVAERIAEWKQVGLGEVMEATWRSTVTVYGMGKRPRSKPPEPCRSFGASWWPPG